MRKTKEQKLKAQLRRFYSLQTVDQKHESTPISIGIKKQSPIIPQHSISYPKNPPQSQDFSYVAVDLKKIGILTLAAFLLQAVLFFLIESELVPFLP